MKLFFLGTGTSYGVPQLGCHCAVCESKDPRDRRTRVGAIVESAGGSRVLIDTPPELRLQMLAAGIDSVDAVLFTHDHADHTHGIDDIRAISVRRGSPLPVYGPANTLGNLARRFPYVFDDRIKPLPGTAKPEARPAPVVEGETLRIGDLEIIPIAVPHGDSRVFGYRIGALGYVTDAKFLPDAAIAALRGCRVLVLNALFRTEHPTHMSLTEAVHAAREVGADVTYLTHLTHDNFHAQLEAELPPEIRPAWDGLMVEVSDR